MSMRVSAPCKWKDVLRKRRGLNSIFTVGQLDNYRKEVESDRATTRSRMLRYARKVQRSDDGGNDTDLPAAKRSRLSQDIEFWYPF